MKLTLFPALERIALGKKLRHLVAGLFTMPLLSLAAGPTLNHPTSADFVALTIPYFDWEDHVPHPYEGTYEIQIDNDSDCSSPFDTDTVPAFISHYSPTAELSMGTTYYWRVRHVDTFSTAGDWSSIESFSIAAPSTVVDVAISDGWAEIKTKLATVVAAGGASSAAELRFPVGHTFNLTQVHDPEDETTEYLLYLEDAQNVIINGRGSEIVIRSTAKNLQSGFFLARSSDHLQVKDITLDYTSDSLMQYGGEITGLTWSEPSGAGEYTRVAIEVEVDPAELPYRNFAELAHDNHLYFVDSMNLQRVGTQGTHYEMENTWEHARTGPHTFLFHGSTRVARFDDELQVGDYAISSGRGGDAFILFNNVSDFVANDVTVNGCRSRYFILRKNVSWARCINNDFLRTDGRLRGAPSGGVNDHGLYTWFENVTLDHSRDDAFHSGQGDPGRPEQTVVRNLTVNSAFRNSIWVNSDRAWIEGNTTNYPGTGGINIGSPGKDSRELRLVNVALIKDNVVNSPRRYGIATDTDQNLTSPPDVETGYVNQYITITGNTVNDFGSFNGFQLDYLENSVIENNTVANPNATGFRVDDWDGDASEDQSGFMVRKSRGLSGTGNSVTDSRVISTNQEYELGDTVSVNISMEVNSSGPGDTAAPAAPTGFSALAEDGEAVLDWADNTETDFEDYSVYRSNALGGEAEEISAGLSASELSDSPLANRNTYYYLVAANDTDGRRSDFSVLGTPFVTPDTIREDWKGTSTGSYTGTTSIVGEQTWALDTSGGTDPRDFELEVLDDTVLNSRSVARTTTAVLSGGSSTGVDTFTAAVTSVDPVSNPVVIRFKFRYNTLTTSGRAEARVGLHEVGTNQLYHVAINAKSDAAPLSLTVNAAGLDLGTVGDQNTISLWEVEALFDRTGSSETTVDYTVWQDGVVYVTDSETIPEAVDGSTLFDESFFQYRQNALILLDDLQLSWGEPGDSTAPAAPTLLALTPSHTSISLDWDDNTETDLAGYNVYRHDGAAYQLIDSVEESDYVDSNSAATGNTIESDTAYYYQVTAVDVSGNESGTPATGSATTLPAKLARPSNVVIVGGNEEVSLGWTANIETHFEYYEVQRADVADGSFTSLSATLTSASYTDSGLTNGEDYYYRIRSIDDQGYQSSWSTVVSAQPDTVVLRETWEQVGLVPEALSGITTLEANNTWSLNADDHVVEIVEETDFGSKAFGRPDLDAVGGGNPATNDDHYVDLEHALVPGTHDVQLSMRAVFADTTTSGRSDFRFGLTDDDTNPVDGYEISLSADTTQSPFTLSVGNASVSVGTAGDQSNGSVWDIEATFTRLSSTSTQVDYVLREDGVAYTSGSTTVSASLSGSLQLDLGRIEVRQRGTVLVDDLVVAY